MATSGTISKLSTVRDLIHGALRKLGVLDNHEDVQSFEDAMQELQWMFKEWQADGCNLWREQTISIVWPAATASQVMNPRVMAVQGARFRDSATFERELGRFEVGQYRSLPNKIAAGFPTIYTFHKQTGSPTLYLWPVPPSQVTIEVDVARVIEDVTELTQTVDLPQEWESTIVYNLAARLVDDYDLAETSPKKAARITAYAAELYENLKDMDRPASVFMGPWGEGA